jgi:alkylation response protein AidB-like acyl-CoA dehydrogenase
MDFGFTAEQDELRSQARRFLDRELPLERILAWSADPKPLDRALWQRVDELGWTGITIPEAHGGLGLGFVDLIVVLEEMGRSLCPLPLLTTDAGAAVIIGLGDDQQRRRLLPGIASGDAIATLALLEASDVAEPAAIATTARSEDRDVVLDGVKLFVPDAVGADLLLVAARDASARQDGSRGHGDVPISVFAVPAGTPGVTVTPLVVLDATKPAAEVRLDSVRVPASSRLGAAGAAWPVLARVLDRMTIGLAAEMVGASDGAITMAVQYAKVRQQFGSPIGRFQAVKHRCAELLVDLESARSLVYCGAWAVDQAPDEAASYAAMAKAAASEALDAAGEECIQIHGAIGYTWECHAHLFYKRGRHCHAWLGAPDEHYERVLALQRT